MPKLCADCITCMISAYSEIRTELQIMLLNSEIYIQCQNKVKTEYVVHKSSKFIQLFNRSKWYL